MFQSLFSRPHARTVSPVHTLAAVAAILVGAWANEAGLHLLVASWLDAALFAAAGAAPSPTLVQDGVWLTATGSVSTTTAASAEAIVRSSMNVESALVAVNWLGALLAATMLLRWRQNTSATEGSMHTAA